MKIILYLYSLLFLYSCVSVDSDKSKEKQYNLKYGIKFFSEVNNRELTITTLYSSDTDFVKSGVFSQTLLADYESINKAIFYFEMPSGKTDTLIYNKKEIDSIQQLYSQNSCLIKTSEHILLNLSNDKVIFYDSILYNIMLYDSWLHKLDTAYYAISDVSIVSILLGQCLYDEEDIPDKFNTQWRYFQVLHIWCENRKLFSLYNEKDFVVGR